jgi:2-aminoethylphosphonate-pyruvate transaminase
MFYSKLNEKGFVIYPGKLSKVDCFRIGNIGQLFPDDIQMLVDAIADVLRELKIDLRVK